jgi:hypothetical protein
VRRARAAIGTAVTFGDSKCGQVFRARNSSSNRLTCDQLQK